MTYQQRHFEAIFYIFIFYFLFSLHPGKDLSSRTETDLNCIFGKRAKPTKTQEEVRNLNIYIVLMIWVGTQESCWSPKKMFIFLILV